MANKDLHNSINNSKDLRLHFRRSDVRLLNEIFQNITSSTNTRGGAVRTTSDCRSEQSRGDARLDCSYGSGRCQGRVDRFRSGCIRQKIGRQIGPQLVRKKETSGKGGSWR